MENLGKSLKCQDKTGMAIEGEIHGSLFKEKMDMIKTQLVPELMFF